MDAVRLVCKMAAEIDSPTDFGGSLSASRKTARRWPRTATAAARSVLSYFARQIREGWIGREDPAGLSDGKRGSVRGIAEFGN